ncbi:MAG: hypothetical protein ACO1SV_14155 [Fimbriimonas sp.]
MVSSRSMAFALLLLSLAGGAVAQGPVGGAPASNVQAHRTLFDVIAQMPWDVAKEGPLVAPISLRIATAATLDELGLRKARVGDLTAIVPKTMATVNSRFTNPPNMYEGMPQEAKMLYLLRSLSPAQWTKATGDGLSLDDCQGEQRAVFDSILPNPFRYSIGTIVEGRGITNPNGPGDVKTLEGAQRAKVKLRVVRELQLHVSLENDSGWTGTEPEDDTKPGMKMPYVIEDKSAQFGHQVIVKSPNAPRKSHLDLKDPRLNAVVPFRPGERVKALLERIGAATGLRFVADPHYATMMMLERGDSATARDLLAALSLGVTGTYRRVGDTYLLTADLEGMGAHVARVALWEDTLKKLVDARSDEWRQAIARSGGFSKIKFSSPAYEGLTEAEKANLEVNDRPNNRPSYIPIQQASKPVQDAIKNWRFGNKIDRQRVGIASNIRYQILLPGLGRGWSQGWLGNTEMYNSKPYTWTAPSPAPVAMPFESRGGVSGLILHADSPAEAKARVARVARLGVGELWLETRNPEALRAAVAAGAAANLRVCLAIRPWEIPAGASVRDPDRTVTGERGRNLAASKLTIEPWWNFWQDIQAFEPPTREWMAPLDPSTNSTIAQLGSLAQTPGLAKVVVLDLYPTGYGKTESNMSGSYWYSNPLDNYLAYGYTDAMREAYLKAEAVDPIDLETQMLRTEINFGPAWGQEHAFAQGYDKWQRAKGKWSRDRAIALAQVLHRADPARPLLMPGEPPSNRMPPLSTTYLYRWDGMGEIPAAPQDFGGGPVPEATEARVLDIVDDRDAAQRNRVADRLKEMLEKRKRPIVLDFTAVPPARLEAVLTRWLKDRQ